MPWLRPGSLGFKSAWALRALPHEQRKTLWEKSGSWLLSLGEGLGEGGVKRVESLRVTEGKHSLLSIQWMLGGVELSGGLQGSTTLSPSSKSFRTICCFCRTG